jgi:hypothetical protein
MAKGVNLETRNCAICNKEFKTWPSMKTKTCGNKCRNDLIAKMRLGSKCNTVAIQWENKMRKEESDVNNLHLQTIFAAGELREGVEREFAYSEGEIL